MLRLKAEPREVLGRKVNKLRQSGQIPAVLYGRGIKSMPLSVEIKEFLKIFKEAGETSILELTAAGKKHSVLVHDLGRDPLSGEIEHIDFYEVKMDEKIRTGIPLIFAGESAAVKSDGGVLVKTIQEVEVEALPKDLPKEIIVDVSSLATFEDKIHIKDLKVGDGVKVLAESEEVVALVVPPRSEKELEEIETKPTGEIGEVPVVGKEEKIAESGEAADLVGKEEKSK